MGSRTTIAILVVTGAAALPSCKSEKKPETTNVVLHANGPDWVNGGTGAFTDESGKSFHGVGIVSGVRDAAFRRKMVDSRARGEIQKTLEEFLDAVQKDNPSSESDPAEKQRFQIALKALAASDAGVRIHGTVLNAVNLSAGRFSRAYQYHYQYAYRRDSGDT